VGALDAYEDSDNQAKYSMSRYTISVEGMTDKLNRYPPNVKNYWKWYENVVASLHHLDWAVIDREILEQETSNNLWRGKDRLQRAREYFERLKAKEAKEKNKSPPAH